MACNPCAQARTTDSPTDPSVAESSTVSGDVPMSVDVPGSTEDLIRSLSTDLFWPFVLILFIGALSSPGARF